MILDDVLSEFKIGYVPCGAECGEGWVPLVRELFQDLIAMGWDRDLHQVKEKFGLLRVYIGAAPDEIHARIAEAEKKSAKVCEECGLSGGKIIKGGYILTLCSECGKKWLR